MISGHASSRSDDGLLLQFRRSLLADLESEFLIPFGGLATSLDGARLLLRDAVRKCRVGILFPQTDFVGQVTRFDDDHDQRPERHHLAAPVRWEGKGGKGDLTICIIFFSFSPVARIGMSKVGTVQRVRYAEFLAAERKRRLMT